MGKIMEGNQELVIPKGKMMEEAEKVIASTILSYMNVPLMDSFVEQRT